MEINVMKTSTSGKWIHGMSVTEFDDKWEAFDNARERYPNATINVEGVGSFRGGTLRDSNSEVSGIRGEAAPTERHS